MATRIDDTTVNLVRAELRRIGDSCDDATIREFIDFYPDQSARDVAINIFQWQEYNRQGYEWN